MDQFSDLITAIQTDINVDSNSTFYTTDIIKSALNRSYAKCAGFYRWPQLEDSQTTSSIANQEYYDYPDNWRPNSIWKLVVAGADQGSPLAFRDYSYEKDHILPGNLYPSGRTTIWTNQAMRYFFSPVPTSNGNNDIVIWGIKTAAKLVNDTDTTIFSQVMPECNEAVILEATAILKNKGDLVQPVQRSLVGGTLLLSIEAQNILTNTWRKVQEENTKYQKTVPFFAVPDFFGRKNSVRDLIGDFE